MNLQHHHDDDCFFEQKPTLPKVHPNQPQGFLSLIWNWQPKKDYLFLQLVRESNIHGIKYIAQPNRHIIERLFWIVIVLCSTGASVYLSYLAVNKLNKSSAIVSFQPSQTSITTIPFPAVTVCSTNRFKKSSFEKAMRMLKNETLKETKESQHDAELFLRELDHICDASMSFSSRLKYSLNEKTVNLKNRGLAIGNKGIFGNASLESKNVVNMLYEAIPTCAEIVLLCLWEDRVVNCNEIFQQIVADLGVCCSFNMMPQSMLLKYSYLNLTIVEGMLVGKDNWRKQFTDDPKYDVKPGGLDEKGPKYQSKAGQGLGLSLLLNPGIDEYFCAGHDAFGFRIQTHSPIDWPHVAEFGLAVPPNDEMFMNLLPEITIADDSIRSFGVEKRHCLYGSEIELGFYNFYTSSNCINECISKKVIQNCNCLRFDMPFPQNYTKYTYCEGNNFTCSEGIKKQIVTDGAKAHCKGCLPLCNQIEYRAQTSSMPTRDDTNVWLKDKSPSKWAGKNVSIVHVFFAADSVYTRVRARIYGFNELFAGVGGILGFFLGLSVMSLVEPFYFLVRLWIEPKEVARARTASATRAKLFGEVTKVHSKVVDLCPDYDRGFRNVGPRLRNNGNPIHFLR